MRNFVLSMQPSPLAPSTPAKEPPFTYVESFKSNMSLVVRWNPAEVGSFVMVLRVQGSVGTVD